MQKWKYMFITCQQREGGDWMPTNINGKVIPNWFAGTPIYQTSNDLGEKGWELVGYAFSSSENSIMRLVFKRPE